MWLFRWRRCKESDTGLFDMPHEVLLHIAVRLLASARPVARLAAASRVSLAELQDRSGRLLVGALAIRRADTAEKALARVDLRRLKALCVDLSQDPQERLYRQDVDALIRRLGHGLVDMQALEVLVVRLVGFDARMERLRIGKDAWEAFLRGLWACVQHQQLRTLELTSINLKKSRVTEDIQLGGAERGESAAESGPFTFLSLLQGCCDLKELVLAHDEIFSTTARCLAKALGSMASLKRLDLTRNYIAPQAMKEIRESLPRQAQLHGEETQTHIF